MKIRAQIFEPGSTSPREDAVSGESEDGERLAGELLKQLRRHEHEHEHKTER
jgi:hypothetical protein